MICGNAVMAPAPLKTVILEDSFGNEFVGVVTNDIVNFDATDNDVREGKTYASGEGASVGTKDIPGYYTTTGVAAIAANKELAIQLKIKNRYNYTEFQAMTMPFNSNIQNSVAVDKAVIQDKVYNVGSTEVISTISKNDSEQSISLGIINGDVPTIIRYFTYKEEY